MMATWAKKSVVTAVGTIALAASVLLGAAGASAAPSATPRHPQPDPNGEVTSVVSGAGLLRAPAWAIGPEETIGGGREQGRFPIGFLAEC